jgi:hypothetical protein
MNVSRIPSLPMWREAGAWVDKNEDGNAAFIRTLSKAPDLHRTMKYARDRALGNLALLKAAGLASGTPINLVGELLDLEHSTATLDFKEQVAKKLLKLKKTNDCPF